MVDTQELFALRSGTSCAHCGADLDALPGIEQIGSDEARMRYRALHLEACRTAAIAPVDPQDALQCDSCQ